MTMLDRMRRHKGWLKWSLAIVVLAFVFLYVPGFMDQSGGVGMPNEVLARVGDREILRFDFPAGLCAATPAVPPADGCGNMSEEVLRSLGIDRQVLQQMIDGLRGTQRGGAARHRGERRGSAPTDRGVPGLPDRRAVHRRDAVPATACRAASTDRSRAVRGRHSERDHARAPAGGAHRLGPCAGRRGGRGAPAPQRAGARRTSSHSARPTSARGWRRPTTISRCSSPRSRRRTRFRRSGGCASS